MHCGHVVLGEFHFHQMLPNQNGVFSKLMILCSALSVASTLRLALLLGAGSVARALLSSLSTGVGSGVGTGACAFQTDTVPPAFLKQGLWGSLSLGITSTSRLASLLALALVLVFSVALPRPVVPLALALSLALTRPVVSLTLVLLLGALWIDGGSSAPFAGESSSFS